MKRKTICLLLAGFLACCLLPFVPQKSAAAQPAPSQTFRAKEILGEFINGNGEDIPGYPDRTLGTQGESDAALYLARFFYELGLSPYLSGEKADFTSASPQEEYAKYLSKFSGTNYAKDAITSYNVSCLLPAAVDTPYYVVIGAHYDDVYGFPKDNSGAVRASHGAYDNGTGVATMLALAEVLSKESLAVNVIFAGFGAEEVGLQGSRQFVSRMSADFKQDFDNLLLMYNLDVVGAGDYLYLYTNDMETVHGEYLYGLADGLEGVNLRRPPRDKKLILSGGTFDDLPYEHVGQMSDHASFYNAGVNVAFFFSMNWDTYRKTGAVESVDHPAIMHTADDTVEKLEEYYKDTYGVYMENAARVVAESLRQADFVEVMLKAADDRPNYSFWTNGWWLLLISFGVLLICLGIVLLMYFKARKKAGGLTPPPSAAPGGNADPFYVFGEGLDGSPQSGEGDGEDSSVFGKDFEGK